VEHSNRSITDKWFGILYALSYVGFLSTGFFLVSKAKAPYSRNENGDRIISEHFTGAVQTCCDNFSGDSVNYHSCRYLEENQGNRRRLTSSNTTTLDGDEGIFDAFLEAPEIIIGIFLTAFATAILWVVALRFFAKPIVILSELSKIGIAIAMGIYQEDTAAKVIFFLIAAGLAGYTYWAWKKIIFASRMIAHSTIAMKENPAILGGSLVVKCLFAGNAALLVFFASRMVNVVELDKEDCYFFSPVYVPRIGIYLGLSYLWTIALLDTVRLSIIANIVGSWHFHPENMPTFIVVFKNILPSFGTLSAASLVTTIAEKLCRMATERSFCDLMCLCVNPFSLLLCIFSSCLNGVVKMLTKFCVILHVFTGNSTIPSAKSVYKILSRHFKGGFVTEVTSRSVLSLASYAFSVGLAMATWAWVDDRFNCNSFISVDGTAEAYLIVWVLVMLFNVYFPVIGIYLMILLNQVLRRSARRSIESGFTSDNHIWLPAMSGIFVGAVCMMLFTFLSKIFLDTIDTLFLCFAIDKDNNVDMSNQEFAELVKEIPTYTEAEVMSEDGDAETGKADAVLVPMPSAPPVVAVAVGAIK